MTNGEPACDMSALLYFYICNYNSLFLLILAKSNEIINYFVLTN